MDGFFGGDGAYGAGGGGGGGVAVFDVRLMYMSKEGNF